MNNIIRLMKKEDGKEILDMMQIFYNSSAILHKASKNILEKDIQDCISNNPFIEGFVFEYDNKIAGYSMIAKSYSTEYGGLCIWIEDIYIKPEYRGLGIGSTFFKYIDSKYQATAVRFRLEVESNNKQAIRVYKKSGYKQLPYIQMTKEL